MAQAVGDLVLVGNKLTSIAGYTSRVSELLEMVAHLQEAGNKPFTVIPEKPKEDAAEVEGIHEWIAKWKKRCDEQRELRITVRQASVTATQVVGGGEIRVGDDIEFDKVDIVSPEGKLLVTGKPQ